jgi:glutamine cyclotransferase
VFGLEPLRAAGPSPGDGDIPCFGYAVVRAWPHSRSAFTEGLAFFDGTVLESTGLNGHSTLAKIDLATGRRLQTVTMPEEFFGEGMTVLNGRVYQLTWKNQKGFIYDVGTLKVVGTFAYGGEGWGLTTDGQALIMSDGSNRLRFLDPATFAVIRTIDVRAHGRPVSRLNELEYVDGEIYANVWGTEFVLRIDPQSGIIRSEIDFVGILPSSDRRKDTDVMNGIAYDAARDRLFVTGKNWPSLFEVRVKKD